MRRKKESAGPKESVKEAEKRKQLVRQSWRLSSLTAAAICALFLAVQLTRGRFSESFQSAFLVFSDAISVTAILLLLIWGALELSKGHVLDLVGYAVYQSRYLLMREKPESYMDFYSYRRAKENTCGVYWPWIALAGILLLLGAICSQLFYSL